VNPKKVVLRADLEDRLRFESMLADLSSRFVNLPSADVDHEIEDAQRRICECLGLDVSALWQKSGEEPHDFLMTHLYRALGGPPVPERMDARDYFPWCLEQILKGENVRLSNVSEAPAAVPAPAGAPPIGAVVSALPAGRVTTPKDGIEYYNCAGVFYRSTFQGNNLVYVVVQQP